MNRRDRPALKQAESISNLLDRLLKKPGIGRQISRHQAWLIWDQIVGPQIALRARPKRLRRGILEVQVDNPVWMHQLHMLKPKILEKIAQLIPDAGISDLFLRQAPNDAPQLPLRHKGESKPHPWETIELESWEKRKIEEELSRLKDGELKDELRKLLRRQKQLDKARALKVEN